jgi:hypothetical protein
VRRVEPDLLVRLAKRGALERAVAGLEAAAREGHLSLVRADVVRAFRQHDVQHVLPDEQRDQDGGRAVVTRDRRPVVGRQDVLEETEDLRTERRTTSGRPAGRHDTCSAELPSVDPVRA